MMALVTEISDFLVQKEYEGSLLPITKLFLLTRWCITKIMWHEKKILITE